MSNYLEENGYYAYLDAAGKTLRPCPICNGEVKYTSGIHCGDDFENGTLRCDSCGLEKRVILYGYGNYDPLHAFDAWNTRAERTCIPHVEPRTFTGDAKPSFYQAICDCGWIVGEDGTPNLSEFEHVDPYCGGCGAKVVVE